MADKDFDVFLRVQTQTDQIQQLNEQLGQTQQKLDDIGGAGQQATDAMQQFGLSMGSTLALGAISAAAAIAGMMNQWGESFVAIQEDLKKASDELNSQILIWASLAQGAQNFADVVKLAGKEVSVLTALTNQLAEAQAKPLGAMKSIADFLVTSPLKALSWSTLGGLGAGAKGPFEYLKDLDVAGKQEQLNRALKEADSLLDQGSRDAARFSDALKNPAVGLPEFNKELGSAKDKLQELYRDRAKSADDAKAWFDQAVRVRELKEEVEKLDKAGEKQRKGVIDDQKEQAKAADQNVESMRRIQLLKAQAGGDADVIIQTKVTQAYQEQYEIRRKLGDSDEAAVKSAFAVSIALGEQLKAQQALKDARGGGAGGGADAITTSLVDQRVQLQAILSLTRAIDIDPFASSAQKAAAHLHLIPAQLAAIAVQSERLRGDIRGGLLDPDTLAHTRQLLLQNDLAVIKLGNDLKKATAGGELRADLLSWANQFGSTIHQVSGLITESLGGAIDGIANGLTGLIFRTQTLAQSALQMAEAFVSGLIRVGLQMLTQYVLSLVFGEASAKANAGIASQLALAYAPAAALASTASYGGAAVAGSIATAAAVAEAIALAGLSGAGGFQKGGYTGNTLGIVHPREYVMDAQTVARAGGPSSMDNLRVAINRTARGGGTGPAGAGGAGSGQHFYFFTDKTALHNHWQTNPASKKIVIDWVNQSGGHLRV